MAFPKVEVIDQGQTALLLRVLTGPYTPYARHYLVGQDSSVMGQPFVTQVPKATQTVEQAFDYLMPKPVKDALARGLKVRRQGDWFFIPSPAPQGPSYHLVYLAQMAVHFRERPQFQYGALYHDVFDREPTRHTVRACSEAGIDEGSQVVYRSNGHHYVRGIVEAPDHAPLYLQDWHVAHRACAGQWGRDPNRRVD